MTGSFDMNKPRYGLFTLAALVYTAGVIAFSVWSYRQQRTVILEQLDVSLVNATYAAEQILDDIMISCAVRTGSEDGASYTGDHSALERYAQKGGYGLIAAVACRQDKLEVLVMGGAAEEETEDRSHCIHRFIHVMMAPFIRELADEGAAAVRTETADLPTCGTIHVALRYRPLTADSGYTILVARSTAEATRAINRLAIRTAGIGILLYIMAFPLILLYHCAQTRARRENAELHKRLREEFEQLRQREAELNDAISDLERFNRMTIGREERIIELKAEVNALLEQLNQSRRYNVD